MKNLSTLWIFLSVGTSARKQVIFGSGLVHLPTGVNAFAEYRNRRRRRSFSRLENESAAACGNFAR